MGPSADESPIEHAKARTRLFGAWAGELANSRARVAQIERSGQTRGPTNQDLASALEELKLTYEELSVAEEELRTQNEELRRAQQQIEQDRLRYLELFRNAPVPYLITNAEGTVQDANEPAGRLLQCRTDRLAGKPLVVFTHDTSRRRMRAAIRRLLDGADEITFLLNLTPRDRDVLRVQVHAAAVRDLEGKLREIRWQLVDQRPHLRAERVRRSRAVRLEALIAERTADLTRAQRLKDQLLATVSHELRTPLAAIGGYSDILSAGLRGPLTDLQRSDVDRIHRAYEHMARVVDDLLSYTRITSGRLAFDLQDAQLATELQSVMELVAPQAGERDITLNVADAPADSLVRADAERLRQILLNVLGNAVKFTPPGGTVSVRPRIEGDVAFIEVEDTGPGIPIGQREAIFEPFVRLSGDSKTQGVGLGLAISREMARAMGGDLTVTGEPGVGSCFALRIPLSMPLAPNNGTD